MRIEEVIGQRIRQRREKLGLSQAQLGKVIGSHGGREWSRQAVSAAEQGNRNFAAAELIMLAHCLDISVGQLLTPPPGTGTVEIAPGITAERDAIILALVPAAASSSDKAPEKQLEDVFTKLLHDIRRLYSNADKVAEDIDLMRRLSITLAQASAEQPSADRPISVEEALEQPVVAAIVTSDLGVLAGKRNDGKPPWTFIAGEIEPGESPADAAVREVKEETALRVSAGDVIGERVHPKTGRTMIYMAAVPTHGTEVVVGDEAELAEVRWLTLAEADELLPGMFEPVREYLQREIGE